MSLYKIADVITEINPQYDFFKNNAEPYLYSGAENAQIKLKLNYEFLQKKQAQNPHMTMGGIEAFYLSALFGSKIIAYNAMVLHSSAILYKGKAYLFSADSGVGKSTHTRQWIKRFGADKVTIINDDLPVIKNENGKFFVYGTPFDGGTCINQNIKVPLGAIIFLERDEKNSISQMPKEEIFFRIYKNTRRYGFGKKSGEVLLSNVDLLIKNTPFYLLKCNTEPDSVSVCEEKLRLDCLI